MLKERIAECLTFTRKNKAAWLLLFAMMIRGGLFSFSSAELKKEYDRWVRRSWTTENGLPQNTVYALAQDSNGFLWIGSEGGLARFDGFAFTVFKKNTTLGLASNSITSLSGGRDGALWVGTFGGGLLRGLNGKFSRMQGLDSEFIWSLHRDNAGTLWAVTTDRGIYCLEEGRDPALAVIAGLTTERITAIAGNGENGLWIGTAGGLVSIRDGVKTVIRARDGLAGDYIYCLFTDSRGSLWAGTTTGLSRIDHAGMRNFTRADGLADDLVRAIGEDGQGRLWIGTDKGVTVMEPGESALCAAPDGLAGDAIMAVYRDHEGGMWLGTSAGGLHYLVKNEVRVHGPGDGLTGRQFRSIVVDPDGRLWAGTRDRGLNLLEKGKWRSISRREGLASDAITALMPDGSGRLWIGTVDAGLQLMDLGTLRSQRPPEGRGGSRVLSLFSDRSDNLWVGSDGDGLDLFSRGTWRHHGLAAGLPAGVITAIGEDRRGSLWVGSAGAGLHVLRQGSWHHYTAADGLAADTVYAIHIDEKDDIWLGTNGGLFLLREGKFFHFREGPEWLGETILQILEDGSGRLWMSTPAGILCAARSELERSIPAQGRGVHCRLFDEMSGMRSAVCTGGFQPAGCRDRSGRLWFPTQNGLVEIDPETLAMEPPALLPRLEKIQADGLTRPLADPVTFAPGTASIEFQYTAAAFADPRQVEFSTKLDGFEADWSRPAPTRSRRFAPLGAGSYVFRIRARSRSGSWHESSASFSFSIRPYFHHTPWFFALLLAGSGMAVAGVYGYRRRQAQRVREDRYRSSSLSAEKTTAHAARLEAAMEKEKLYRAPDLTLGKLAEGTGIPAKHLSQVINERFGLNFNDYVNRLRIEEAKRLLLDPATSDFKLLRIAFESGFNSKSVFNAAFKKHTGLSPSEFRQLLGNGT